MKQRPALLLVTAIFLLLGLIYISPDNVASAATATHIVISEIQVAGATTSDDFIEIYNPTNAPVSLNGYRIVKHTSTGATDSAIMTFGASDTIAANAYFL